MRRALVFLSSLPSIALLGSACLDPLPEATSCDPPARVVGTTCVQCEPPRQFAGDKCIDCPPPSTNTMGRCLPNAFSDYGVPQIGCLAADGRFDRFTCLRGPTPECDCGELEAPDDDDPVCFEDGACPPAVLAIDEDALCLQIAEEAVTFAGAGPSEGCGCGCMADIAHCDGRGFAFGLYTDGTHTEEVVADLIRIALPDELPSTGAFGVYLVMRGFAFPAFVVLNPTDPPTTWGFYLSSDYDEHIAFGPGDEGIDLSFMNEQPYVYTPVTGRPAEIFIGRGAEPGEEAFAIFEVDCIIPFIVPVD